MKNISLDRRLFLKKAGHGLMSAPLAAALPIQLSAEIGPKHRTRRETGGQPRPPVALNVRDFGATGDGKTLDTNAIQKALDRCSVVGGGQVRVPAGEYLTGALVLRSNTNLHIEEGATLQGSPDFQDYPLTQVRWEGKWIDGYIGFISAMDAENISITGKGKIVATPAIKMRVDTKTKLRHPALLEFVNCRNVNVQDVHTLQTSMWSIHPVYCENVSFRNVTVKSGADGIDVDSCKHVIIDGCTFETTDDCISLKSGRGEEGNTISIPTEDVHISNCEFKDEHWACIGIGSETSGGIRNVHVEHCKCLGARTFAIYIKSRPGRGAFIQDIWMNDLDVSGAGQGFLRFNFLDSGKQDEVPVPGIEGIPTVGNFHFSNIRVHEVPTLVEAFAIDARKPLVDFTLTDVTGTCSKGILLANIKGAKLNNIRVTGYSGPLISTYNVTGKGTAGAAVLTAPKTPPDVPAALQPYVLH